MAELLFGFGVRHICAPYSKNNRSGVIDEP